MVEIYLSRISKFVHVALLVCKEKSLAFLQKDLRTRIGGEMISSASKMVKKMGERKDHTADSNRNLGEPRQVVFYHVLPRNQKGRTFTKGVYFEYVLWALIEIHPFDQKRAHTGPGYIYMCVCV